MVLKKKIPLKEAVEKLGIIATTARFIIKKFQKDGSFPRRKYRRSTKKNYRTPKEKINIHNASSQSISTIPYVKT